MMRVLILAAVLGLVACSSDDADTGVTRDQACDVAAKAFCDQYAKCVPLLVSAGFGDAATCLARTKLGCPASFDAPSTSSTPERVSACAGEVAKLSCESLFQATPAACIPEPGGLADGASCFDDAQCKSTWCAKNDDVACGTCRAQPAVGAACIDLGKKNDGSTQKSCGRGLQCANDLCAKPGALGATCSDTQPCGAALTCFNTKCVAAGKPGAKCDPMGVTDPGCDFLQGAFCNQTTKVCQSIVFAKPGEACGFSATEIKGCSAGGKCIIKPGSATGTCMAPAADGAACNTTDGPDCLAPAKCTNGVCALPSATTCK